MENRSINIIEYKVMKLDLVKVPNELLKQKSEKVDKVDDKLKKFIDDMFETMYKDNGIGLAAVQVGKLLRIVVVDIRDRDQEKNNPMVFINPEVTWFSDEKELMKEGCLSVPGQSAEVLRSLSIEVKYNDIDMNEKTLRIDGDLAHCLQHEIDHTNGIVYIDYLSKLKRDSIIKKVQKLEKFK